jgi:hypothetical protein
VPFENQLPPGADTLLTISGFGEMLYQARGLHQTLEIIREASQLARTIDGLLIDVSNPQFRKYASKITCSDVNAPPTDNVWPGMEVVVGCAARLCYLVGNPGSPARPVVHGSEYINGHFVFYRPELTMLVRDITLDLDEWNTTISWTMTLEEI